MSCLPSNSEAASRPWPAHQNASKQDLDEATAELNGTRAALTAAELRHAEAEKGPTKEELEVADLLAPRDGIVQVIVAELGEAIRPGQPVLTLEAAQERWFSLNILEDRLSGIGIGAPDRMRTGFREREPRV